jgi:hypothetical protein
LRYRIASVYSSSSTLSRLVFSLLCIPKKKKIKKVRKRVAS